MKVCKWSSKTSETKSTQKSSGSDLEDGFINTGITMENKDEAGYTSLQREQVGYQALKPPIYLEVLDSPGTVPPPKCSIAPENDCGYTLPQIQSSQDILDSLTEKAAEPRNTLAQTESCLYEEIPDADIRKEAEPGYLHPLSQSDGNHRAPDVPASSRLNQEAELYVEMNELAQT